MNSKAHFGKEQEKDIELVRRVVLQRLCEQISWERLEFYHEHRFFDDFVFFPDPDLKPRFYVLVVEVLWEFIGLGIITPGLSQYSPLNTTAAEQLRLPFFHVTMFGREALKNGRVIPQDPIGYFAAAKSLASLCFDDVAQGYLEEALRCFSRTCYTAATLLLGVTSEACFLRLCDAVEQKLSAPDKGTFAGLSSVKLKHRFIIDKYENLPSSARRNHLPDGLDVTLKGVYDLIRRQRNDLGHPQNVRPEIDREHAFAHFQCFLTYLGDLEKFALYCQHNGL
jgi:hypothetical protein